MTAVNGEMLVCINVGCPFMGIALMKDNDMSCDLIVTLSAFGVAFGFFGLGDMANRTGKAAQIKPSLLDTSTGFGSATLTVNLCVPESRIRLRHFSTEHEYSWGKCAR